MKDYPDSIMLFGSILDNFKYVTSIIFARLQQLNQQKSRKAKVIYLENIFLELNRKFIFDMMAAFEAKLVYFYKNICTRTSLQGRLYRQYIPAKVRTGGRPMMYQHMLPIFKNTVYLQDSKIYSGLIDLIEYRNWLAHGRSWALKPHIENINFEYAWVIIQGVFNAIDDYPEELKK